MSRCRAWRPVISAPSFDPLVVQDDARQHVFWMQRLVDPSLLQDDLFADYFASQAPPGFVLLYRGLLLFANPLTASKLLPPVLGLLAAVWCAMVTMVLGVTYGFVLALATPGRLAHNLAGDPDYRRSGWTDVKAFVLANTFDNGFTHLLGGLIVASGVGLIGSLIGTRLAHPRQPQLDRPDHIRPVISPPAGTESAT